MKAKKIISLLLVITTMICSFTVFTHATNDHLALSTVKINVETIFMNNKDYYFKFSEQLPNSMIDKDSVSVIGVTPLYDLASNQTIAYLVDVCDENDDEINVIVEKPKILLDSSIDNIVPHGPSITVVLSAFAMK